MDAPYTFVERELHTLEAELRVDNARLTVEVAALDRLMTEHRDSHREIHAADQKALGVAERELAHWRETHNGVDKKFAECLKIEAYAPQHRILVDRIEALRKECDVSTAALSDKLTLMINSDRRLIYMGVGIVLAVQFIVGGVIIAAIPHLLK